MPTVPLPSWVQELSRRQTWLRGFATLLFLSCTFSVSIAHLAIVGLYLVALYQRLRTRGAEALPWWMGVAFVALPAVAVLAALANGFEAPLRAGDVAPNVTGNLQNLRGLFRFALPLALLPALAVVNRRHLLLTLLVSSAAMAFYAAIQFRWGVDWFRPEGKKLITPYFSTQQVFQGVFHGKGNFSHHLTFAGVMLMLAPLFAALAWEEAGRARWAWGAGALLAVVGVLATLSRGGWLGVGAGLLALWLRFPRRMLVPLGTVAALVVLAWALFGPGRLGAKFASPGQPALIKRFLTISLSQNRERLFLWESALMGIRDRPWLGVGYRNDEYYAPAYRSDIAARRHFSFKIRLKTHMHNIYLQMGFELGLIGLAAYLFWLFAIIHWNRLALVQAGGRFPFERGLLYGASGGLAGMMVAGFFEANFFDSEVQTVVFILMGLSLHAGLVIRQGHGQNQPVD